MDIGESNFRFTLDDPEKKSRAIRYPQSAELHVSSLDRFNSTPTVSQTIAQLSSDTTSLPGSYNYSSANCVIQTKKALLYGYFNRVAMSEMQIQFRVPTVVAGVNNTFYLAVYAAGVSPPTAFPISIPTGYYTPTLLAAAIQAAIRAASTTLSNASIFTVSAPTNQSTINALTTGAIQTGFVFTTGTSDLITLAAPPSNVPLNVQLNVWKFYRLIGTNFLSFNGYPSNIPTAVVATGSPNFLPTDYIDVVSKALTNYKDSKDTNTNESAPQGVLGRIYLTDMGSNPQIAMTNSYPDPNCLGSAPFTFTKKWCVPNWSLWSPNQAINTVDIQLLDMFGTELYYSNVSGCGNTEWQMTLIASE